MCSNVLPSRDQVLGLVDDYRSAVTALAALPPAALDALNFPDLAAVLDTMETGRRQTPVLEHAALNALTAVATPEQVGGSVKRYLADRLRIHPAEAHRRIADAEALGARRTLTGEPLPPVWRATAQGQRAGAINSGHVREIARFFHKLPGWVDAATREIAEQTLAAHATKVRPDELRKLADILADCLNPDGNYTDDDRARARGLTIGPQDSDGMVPFKGWLTPEAAAGIEAILGKWAAPGMCNPHDQSPVVDGEPTDAAKEADTRSTAMRNHDALLAMTRSVLSSGQLGSHHGLPVSIVVTTTLQELESAAGIAHTGGATTIPMPDVIRMASHARHYLRIYDKHTSRELYLADTKRIASPAQRIVLHAKDRGCSRPGCTAPGYLCQVHHVDEWAQHHRTDIDTLTFVCGPDHKLLDEEGWTTRKNADGITEWIPPPQLDFGKPTTNGYWHPQRYFSKGDDDDGGGEGQET
jgi:hypothetical protein